MTETVQYRFLIRRGTAAALTAANEVPLIAEMVVETDQGLTDGKRKIKIGDGVAHYNDLPYLSLGGILGWIDIVTESPLNLAEGSVALGADVDSSTELLWNSAGMLPTGVSLSSDGTLTSDGSVTDNSEWPILFFTADHANNSGSKVIIVKMVEGTADPDFADRFSLLPFKGADGDTTFADIIAGNTWTGGGVAKLSSTQKKFGTTSLYLNGSSYITSGRGAGDWKFLHDATTAWTIEGWIYPNNNLTTGGIFDTGAAATLSVGVWVSRNATNQFDVRISRNASGVYRCSAAGGSIPQNAWTYVKALYDPAAADSKPLRVMVGGVEVATSASSGAAITTNPTSTGCYGRYAQGNSLYLNAYLDNWRITKGIADYSTDIPATPFPTHG